MGSTQKEAEKCGRDWEKSTRLALRKAGVWLLFALHHLPSSCTMSKNLLGSNKMGTLTFRYIVLTY